MPGIDRNLSLFPRPAKVPDGFIYQPDFISEAEEQVLIQKIQKLHFSPFKYFQFTGKRRTVSFGWQYAFGADQIATAPDAPAFLLPLRTRAGAFFNIDPNCLVQTTVIEYSTGSPIGWHRDIPHFSRCGRSFSRFGVSDQVSKIFRCPIKDPQARRDPFHRAGAALDLSYEWPVARELAALN